MQKFKDSSISRKLSVSFLGLLAILLIVGGTGVAGMIYIDKLDTYLYESQTAPIQHLFNATESLYQIRVYARGAAIYAGDSQKLQNMETSYLNSKKTFQSESALYRQSIKTSNAIAAYEEANKIFTDSFDPVIQKVFEKAKSGDGAGADAIGATVTDQVETLFQDYDKLMNYRMASAKSTSDSNDSNALIFTIVLSVMILATAVSTLILSRKVSRMISKPITEVVSAANKIALGSVDIDLSDVRSKDETGQLITAFAKMADGIRQQVAAVEEISHGNFTCDVPLRSEADVMGLALLKIKTELNEILLQIHTSAEQVSIGSEQIAVGAQSLASGATEQASSVEELTSTITEVATQIKENAENATEANELSQSAQSQAVQGNEKMGDMLTSISEINDASKNISQIIKVIDEIAFQTNILALNAAVEAARAGEYGKGFAVVAEEVRSLAAKSSQAAKETTALIGSSVEKAESGTKVAQEAAGMLNDICESIRKASSLVSEIAVASNQQASAVAQINQGINQVSMVVQNNSATAEESAASSEELSGQATMLKQIVNQFKLDKGNSVKKASQETEPKSRKETHCASNVSLGSANRLAKEL